MKFTFFRFKNFKGIEDETLDLSKNPESNIFTLVGLNESGKTTILEAINFFKYKSESLDVLELKEYEVKDIHSLIPINKRDNFNGTIWIEAGLELDEDDVINIKKEFLKKGILVSTIDKKSRTHKNIILKIQNIINLRINFYGIIILLEELKPPEKIKSLQIQML